MKKTAWVIFAAFAALHISAAAPERKVEICLKDIARLQGVRSNQLMGYGVVVGLDATGDKDHTKFTVQSLTNLMARQGINIDPAADKEKNVAAVMVTTELPPFSRSGQRIDVTVSSTGDAKSLAGGTLLMTPLMGPDNQVYAVAQGPILVGGFAAVTRGGGSTAAKNHPTAGRIPDGALIEREVPVNFSDRTELRYALLEEDFSTAVQVAGAINEEVGEMAAKALDPRTIDVVIPREFRGRVVELAARLENLLIQTQPKSRVVVNEKTGTLIMGADVRVGPVNIVHGGSSIQVSNALDEGTVQQGTAEGKGKTLKIESGVTVGQLAESLNAMGTSPQDLVAILQAVKDAGALSAELRIL
jgi:flagellar P-ring protein precursor FlgI